MPPKSKPDSSGLEKLKKELAAGRPGKLYIFHGEETYLRDYYLGKLRDAVLTSAFPLGVSNRFTGRPAAVSVREGTLLVMWDEPPAGVLAHLFG